MPQIIVIADSPAQDGAAQVLFRERVTQQLLESEHFARQLAERLAWAVGDAEAADRRGSLGQPALHHDAEQLVGVSAETSRDRQPVGAGLGPA